MRLLRTLMAADDRVLLVRSRAGGLDVDDRKLFCVATEKRLLERGGG